MKKLSFHPLTWWIFSGAIAFAIARVNSPVFAIAAVGVMSMIVCDFRAVKFINL